MISPNNTMLRLMEWIARRLGIDLGIRESSVFDSLDEREVTEQLHYGRD